MGPSSMRYNRYRISKDKELLEVVGLAWVLLSIVLALGLSGCGSIQEVRDPFPDLPNVKLLRLHRGKAVPCGNSYHAVGCWNKAQGVMDIDAQWFPKKTVAHEKCHARASLLGIPDTCHKDLGPTVDL